MNLTINYRAGLAFSKIRFSIIMFRGCSVFQMENYEDNAKSLGSDIKRLLPHFKKFRECKMNRKHMFLLKIYPT